MVPPSGASHNSPWDAFGLRNKFGTHQRKDTTKAKKKRLQSTGGLPRRKKKKKKQVIQELFQSHFTADGGIIYNDAESFADVLVPKPPQTFRCASHNISLLPESARHQKSRRLINHIREAQLDILLMQEVGLYWSKLDPSDQWVERVRSLPDSTAVFAHNTLEPQMSSSIQYGGVGIVATSKVRHRMVERGRTFRESGTTRTLKT